MGYEDLIAIEQDEWVDRLREDSAAPEEWRAQARRVRFSDTGGPYDGGGGMGGVVRGLRRSYLELDLQTLRFSAHGRPHDIRRESSGQSLQGQQRNTLDVTIGKVRREAGW